MNLLIRINKWPIRIIVILFLLFSSCAGPSTNLYTEVKPEFKENEIKRIGIMKFKNQSGDPNAGLKVADIFYKELTSYRQFELIAPAEMSQKGFGMEFTKTANDNARPSSRAEKVDMSKMSIMKKRKETQEKIPVLDAVVTGVITRYNDKDGNAIATNKPASVAFKVFLIRIKDNKILWSANFAETQVALLDNLLLADRFKEAGGVWLTSDALTQLGMQRVIRAFPGLSPDKVKLVTDKKP